MLLLYIQTEVKKGNILIFSFNTYSCYYYYYNYYRNNKAIFH